MTVKERFTKTLGYQIPDRLPVDFIWPRAETLTALKNHFDTDDKEDVFKYHIDYLIQADCVKKIEEVGNNINFEILQAGKVIEKY